MANVAVVETFITALGLGDAEAALGQLHDDVQVSEPASLPIGGEYAGKAAFVGFLGKVAATYDVKIHRAEVMDAGDMALAHLHLTWTAHSTGASLDTQFCELYAIDGDKITSINVFPKDTKALYDLTAAGVTPLP
jgi:ketosteroid isomerase-like protein